MEETIEHSLELHTELCFDQPETDASGETRSPLALKPGELAVVNSLAPRQVTEILRTILGLRRARAGSISILGEDLGRISRRRAQIIRRRLGISGGPVELVSELTVEENLALPCALKKYSKKQIRLRVERIADIFALDELLKLSVGQLGFVERRMVILARALAHDPELILLETPLVGLDEGSRSLAIQEIRRLPISGAAVMVFNDTSEDLETGGTAA